MEDKQYDSDMDSGMSERMEEREAWAHLDLGDDELYDSSGNPLDLPEEFFNKRDRPDKIFGNAFNTGDLDFKSMPDIKAQQDYSESHLGHVYDAEHYNNRLRLEQLCGQAFDRSQWSETNRDKQFPKEIMPYVFNELFEQLDGQGDSVMDIVITIAEFMGGSYEKIYWAMGHNVKARLVQECNQQYGRLAGAKIDRLF